MSVGSEKADTPSAGPLAVYKHSISLGEIQADTAQAEAVSCLQTLFDSLVQPPPKPGLLAKVFGGKRVGLKGLNGIKGLYFWGGVGRGKTYLMDVFFDSLPFEEKRRMHFHRFMRHVHQQLKLSLIHI